MWLVWKTLFFLTNDNLTLHFFLLALSLTPNLFTLVLKSSSLLLLCCMDAARPPRSTRNHVALSFLSILSDRQFEALVSTFSFNVFITFFAISATFLVFPNQKCCDVIYKDPQLQRRVICVTSLSAPCNTMRRSKQLHFDPGKMAVVVSSGSPTHPSNCSYPLVLTIPAQHSQDLPWDAEVRRPGPQHKKTDPLECLRQVQHQDHCSQIFFHLNQNFPDCLLKPLHFGHQQRPNQNETSAAIWPLLVLSELPTSVSTSA